jgi:hypothetical protein
MRFRSVFGAGSTVVVDVWNRIEAHAPIDKGGQPKHLLWALVLLKVYQSDEVHCALVGWPARAGCLFQLLGNGLGILSK